MPPRIGKPAAGGVHCHNHQTPIVRVLSLWCPWCRSPTWCMMTAEHIVVLLLEEVHRENCPAYPSQCRTPLACRPSEARFLLMPTGLGQAAPLLPPCRITHFCGRPPHSSSTADWMGNMAGTIGNTPLNNLVIPGTHDSGTYGITAQSAPSPDDQSPTCASIQSDVDANVSSSSTAKVLDNLIGKYCGPIIGSISAEWAKAQDVNLTGQLDGGARYLDIRVCPPETSGGSLMICHEEITVYSVPLTTTFGLEIRSETFCSGPSQGDCVGGFQPSHQERRIQPDRGSAQLCGAG